MTIIGKTPQTVLPRAHVASRDLQTTFPLPHSPLRSLSLSPYFHERTDAVCKPGTSRPDRLSPLSPSSQLSPSSPLSRCLCWSVSVTRCHPLLLCSGELGTGDGLDTPCRRKCLSALSEGRRGEPPRSRRGLRPSPLLGGGGRRGERQSIGGFSSGSPTEGGRKLAAIDTRQLPPRRTSTVVEMVVVVVVPSALKKSGRWSGTRRAGWTSAGAVTVTEIGIRGTGSRRLRPGGE